VEREDHPKIFLRAFHAFMLDEIENFLLPQEFVGYSGLPMIEAGRVLPCNIHRSRSFSVLHKDYRQRTVLKGYFFAWIERQRS
jgi:hypothetical protein